KNVGIAAYPKLEIPQPLPNRREQIIFHTGYTVSYNELWRLPNWVAYELTRSETRGAEKHWHAKNRTMPNRKRKMKYLKTSRRDFSLFFRTGLFFFV
ncbi:hypothetical protein EZS27_033653, partial [termite gut metagenome]